MAERHDAKAVLSLARDLVLQLQTLIENKWSKNECMQSVPFF